MRFSVEVKCFQDLTAQQHVFLPSLPVSPLPFPSSLLTNVAPFATYII